MSLTAKHDLAKLTKFVKGMTSQYSVRVGIFGDRSARKNDNVVDNAYVGMVHELGSFSRGIPIRSWLVMPIRVSQNEILKEAGTGIKDLLAAGKMDRVLQELGFACEDAIYAAFESGGFGTWAPLKVRTVKHKLRRFLKQQPWEKASEHTKEGILIDSTQLRKSVTSQVVKL